MAVGLLVGAGLGLTIAILAPFRPSGFWLGAVLPGVAITRSGSVCYLIRQFASNSSVLPGCRSWAVPPSPHSSHRGSCSPWRPTFGPPACRSVSHLWRRFSCGGAAGPRPGNPSFDPRPDGRVKRPTSRQTADAVGHRVDGMRDGRSLTTRRPLHPRTVAVPPGEELVEMSVRHDQRVCVLAVVTACRRRRISARSTSKYSKRHRPPAPSMKRL